MRIPRGSTAPPRWVLLRPAATVGVSRTARGNPQARHARPGSLPRRVSRPPPVYHQAGVLARILRVAHQDVACRCSAVFLAAGFLSGAAEEQVGPSQDDHAHAAEEGLRAQVVEDVGQVKRGEFAGALRALDFARGDRARRGFRARAYQVDSLAAAQFLGTGDDVDRRQGGPRDVFLKGVESYRGRLLFTPGCIFADHRFSFSLSRRERSGRRIFESDSWRCVKRVTW